MRRRQTIKIRKKFSLGISLVVVIVFFILIITNIFFVDKYYIHEQRKKLDKAEVQIMEVSLDHLLDNLMQIEEHNQMVIVYTDTSGGINQINQRIIYEFERKQLKLNKFWITEKTIKELEYKSINKIYDQGINKYRVLTKFIKKDGYIFALGLSLPQMDEAIQIINKFNIFLMLISVTLITVLVFIISRKITKPLEELKVLSQDISNLNFRKQKIETKDEIEELSISINSMSESLEKANFEIKSQNCRLKEMMSGISHEMKTPLAIVKAYEQGIDDGLDDGSFRDIIYDQIAYMDSIVEKLLFWAKIENENLNKTSFDLKEKLELILGKYKLILSENHINLLLNFNPNEEYLIDADEEYIKIILDNLITNAIKYTNNNEIEIKLDKNKDKVNLKMLNGVLGMKQNDLENIWKPFCVMEKSRSKEFSGTGLGLAIVRKILENHGAEFGFRLENKKIEFFVTFM